jgi:hypothetical protein
MYGIYLIYTMPCKKQLKKDEKCKEQCMNAVIDIGEYPPYHIKNQYINTTTFPNVSDDMIQRTRIGSCLPEYYIKPRLFYTNSYDLCTSTQF